MSPNTVHYKYTLEVEICAGGHENEISYTSTDWTESVMLLFSTQAQDVSPRLLQAGDPSSEDMCSNRHQPWVET